MHNAPPLQAQLVFNSGPCNPPAPWDISGDLCCFFFARRGVVCCVGSLHIISERRVTVSSTFNRMHIIAKINQSIRLGWLLMRTDSRQGIPTFELSLSPVLIGYMWAICINYTWQDISLSFTTWPVLEMKYLNIIKHLSQNHHNDFIFTLKLWKMLYLKFFIISLYIFIKCI